MKPLRAWFPGFYTEAHRQREQQQSLIRAFLKAGMVTFSGPRESMDLIFCGSFFKNQEVKEARRQFPKVPVFHYSWDLYPWQLEGEEAQTNYMVRWWKDYIEELKSAAGIFVPSQCTVERHTQFVGRESTVVLAPVHTFEEATYDGGYVLNPVRGYPDPNRDLVEEVCRRANIPCVVSGNNLPWEKFKKVVAGARLLVSAQYEASTGGLSLLEGYALGKPVLLSNSPRHGGKDYFDQRASYFQWDNWRDLEKKVRNMFDQNKKLDAPRCKAWVEEVYSNERFAKEIVTHLRGKL